MLLLMQHALEMPEEIIQNLGTHGSKTLKLLCVLYASIN